VPSKTRTTRPGTYQPTIQSRGVTQGGETADRGRRVARRTQARGWEIRAPVLRRIPADAGLTDSSPREACTTEDPWKKPSIDRLVREAVFVIFGSWDRRVGKRGDIRKDRCCWMVSVGIKT
jgi:hypothetical protein